MTINLKKQFNYFDMKIKIYDALDRLLFSNEDFLIFFMAKGKKKEEVTDI